jgi:DNA-binding CsgD family transcriptional regulator
MSDKEIALRLGVAPRTIRTHLERLFHEYGLSSRSAAVAAWLRGRHHRIH